MTDANHMYHHNASVNYQHMKTQANAMPDINNK